MLLKNVRTIPLRYGTGLIEAYSFSEISSDDVLALEESISRTLNAEDFHNQRQRKVTIIIGFPPFKIDLQESETAISTNIIFVNSNKTSSQGLGNKIVIFTEELVHHFWDTDNESDVKPIVLRILSETIPGLEYNESLGYLDSGKPIGLI